MRKIILLAASLMLAVSSAQSLALAQDPNNATEQLRALIVMSKMGNDCYLATKPEAALAGFEANARAESYKQNGVAGVDEFIANLNSSIESAPCNAENLEALIDIAHTQIKPKMQGYTLAAMDHGICPASAVMVSLRLYGVVSTRNMTAAELEAAAPYRKQMLDHLTTACADASISGYKTLGFAYTLGSNALSDLRDDERRDCDQDVEDQDSVFDCSYGMDLRGGYQDDDKKIARFRNRAALAKATALSIERRLSCGVMSPVEQAVAADQFKMDARLAPVNIDLAPWEDDNEPLLRKEEEILEQAEKNAAGMTCADLTAPIPARDAPRTDGGPAGEADTPAAGVLRTRQTVSRLAATFAVFNECAAFPNFEVTKSASQEWLAGLSNEELRMAIVEARLIGEKVAQSNCGQKFPITYKQNPMASMDALAGNW
ncbi:hypothetical protein FF098_007585 [Parvularcula flava]|uniref:Uncharacterized protein n=1 Tax=Aquisalinus luteolus TaxID=1566827 RepID=A0A8J3A3M1_9PROT|nr:hypothetical protein [Aquisalinus luteolus]NHK27759.1 hypothetical protein [Aquisalinus luteolus]GGH96414.1 hypothetical protein GCM10011355_15260 [Aquisalinus luteolus]